MRNVQRSGRIHRDSWTRSEKNKERRKKRNYEIRQHLLVCFVVLESRPLGSHYLNVEMEFQFWLHHPCNCTLYKKNILKKKHTKQQRLIQSVTLPLHYNS